MAIDEDDLERNFAKQNHLLADFYHDEIASESQLNINVKKKFSEPLSEARSEKYSIVGEIDSGGMKRIHEVLDRDTTRYLAMALPLNGHDCPEDLDNFIREARITALLEHPNIIPVHDIGLNSDKLPYFTMKLIEGESLGQILKRMADGDEEYCKIFHRDFLLEIFLKICDAIAFAHSKGVLHLDLKPENIRISSYGEVQVLDWGLARFLGEKHEVTKRRDVNTQQIRKLQDDWLKTMDGEVRGTPSYMSPEQARGENEERSTRTDVYSLGTILYSSLTYKMPIEGIDCQEILKNTINGKFQLPSQRAPQNDIPMALESVTLKAMELQLAKRYASVDEIVEEIRAWRAGFATKAQKADVWVHSKLLFKRHRLIFNIITVLSLLVVILTLLFILRLRGSEHLARQNEFKAVGALGALQQSDKRTKEAFEELRVSENKTQKALEELQRAEGKRLKVSRIAAEQYYQQALEEIKDQAYWRALTSLKTSIGLDDEHQQAWNILGHLNLCTLKLTDAQEAFEKSANETFLKLLKKESKLSRQSTKTTEYLYKFFIYLNRAEKDYPYFSVFFSNVHNRRLTLESRIDLLRRCLKYQVKKKSTAFTLNEEKMAFSFVYSNKLRRLDFSPLLLVPIRSLTWRSAEITKKDTQEVRFVEKTLKIVGLMKHLQELDLRGQKIDSVDFVRRLTLKRLILARTYITQLGPLIKSRCRKELEELDISHCQILDYYSLLQFTKLKKITVAASDELAQNHRLMKLLSNAGVTIIVNDETTSELDD
ncbi:MAG: serine/threonine protein kinase [Lentisphaeraceae bacterium]|nr:serine/threonine protein kinase [Lentisphaeraceae bacterium]